MINGSPRANGNTATALQEMITVFEKEGMETELIQIGHLAVRGCISCGQCYIYCPGKSLALSHTTYAHTLASYRAPAATGIRRDILAPACDPDRTES